MYTGVFLSVAVVWLGTKSPQPFFLEKVSSSRVDFQVDTINAAVERPLDSGVLIQADAMMIEGH